MTLEEILNVVRNIIDETDIDEQIDIILKDAVNTAYIDLTKYSQNVKTAYVPIINKVAKIPKNCISIIDIEPPLQGTDKVLNGVIITGNTGSLTIVYNSTKDVLVNNTDIIEVKDNLLSLITDYACYVYYRHRKRLDVANSYLQSYQNKKYEVEVDSNEFGSVSSIQDVVGIY